MELPPLSPGIQARVMEEVEVVETVKRGWSGGTGCIHTHTDSDLTTDWTEHKAFFTAQLHPNSSSIFLSPCTTRLTMMVSKPRVLVAVQV